MFPSGIAYISAVLREKGYNLHKLNLNNTDKPVAQVLINVINQNHIDVVLTGGLSGQYGSIRNIVEVVKKNGSQLQTIVGGGIITSAPIYAMKALEFVDYGVIGEGEITICELLDAIENKKSIKKIPHLVVNDKGNYFLTKGTQKAVDIDALPFPDYDGFGLEQLLQVAPNIIGMNEEKTFQIFTSRSCPFACTFCFHSTGRKYRQHSLDRVFEEIDYFLQKYDINYLSIQDELFGYNLDRVEEFCNRIRPYNIDWFAQFRVTDITEKVVKLLRWAHCKTIGLGIESADNTVLKSMNKKITIEDTNKALDIIHNEGIGVQGCLIFGDIKESKSSALRSLQWWKKNIHYGVQLSLIVTYPGTYLFNYALEKKIIKDPVKFIRDTCPVVKLSNMSDKDYSWMVGQILSMQRIPESLPAENKSEVVLDATRKDLTIIAPCNNCGHINTWKNIKIFVAESLICQNCGRRHYAPIPETLVTKISFKIETLINKYETVCFWGINSFFYGFCQSLTIKKTGIRCVDKSKIRQGILVNDIKVQPTQIIKEEHIECIIVAVPQYYSNIYPSIKEEFPNVKQIINILDLV